MHASHLRDASTIAAMDAITEKDHHHGKDVKIVGLNNASALMRQRLGGKLGQGTDSGPGRRGGPLPMPKGSSTHEPEADYNLLRRARSSAATRENDCPPPLMAGISQRPWLQRQKGPWCYGAGFTFASWPLSV